MKHRFGSVMLNMFSTNLKTLLEMANYDGEGISTRVKEDIIATSMLLYPHAGLRKQVEGYI
jgi:hypothetical protein